MHSILYAHYWRAQRYMAPCDLHSHGAPAGMPERPNGPRLGRGGSVPAQVRILVPAFGGCGMRLPKPYQGMTYLSRSFVFPTEII